MSYKPKSQTEQEEHNARMSVIRARLERAANSGEPVPIETAFDEQHLLTN